MSATTAQQHVLDAVKGAGYPAPFHEIVLLVLSQPGRILNKQYSPRFENIITSCQTAAHGCQALVPRAAAAFELCIAASDLLDEIEDGDCSPVVDRVGVPRGLNASTSLLALAYRVLSVPTGDSKRDSLMLKLSYTLSDTILSATIGQEQDLSEAEPGTDLIARAIEIARKKSGSLVAGACLMGALLGPVDSEVTRLYQEFGSHLGTAYQLSNDLRDASSKNKSDLVLGRPTVPLSFQRSTGAALGVSQAETLRDSGALHFTWVLMETERIKCDHLLDELELHQQDVAALKPLLGNR